MSTQRRITVAAAAALAGLALAACEQSGASPAPSTLSPVPSLDASAADAMTPSPSPSAGDESSAADESSDGMGGGDAGGEGDDGAWVNGYVLPGVDDVHFGPEWGPTWFFELTIGEPVAGWPSDTADVPADCPWVATLNSTPMAGVYGISVGDPAADPGSALHFEMVDPNGADPGPADAPRNAEGLAVGMPMDDVLAAYPGSVVAFFDDEAWGGVYEIDVYQPATDTHMFFRSDAEHGDVTAIQWGYFPAGVSWRGHHCAG